MQVIRFGWLCAAIGSLTALVPASRGAPAPAGADSTANAAVVAAMDHYVALIRLVNADSVAAMYTVDAELYEPGAAVLRGRDAIHAFLAPFDGHAKVDTASWKQSALGVYGSTAYLWGSYHQVARLDAQPAGSFNGRFASEWRREPDGQWRIRRFLVQPAPPE